MSAELMPDQRLLFFYEDVRRQVEADRGQKHSFTAGPQVRQYAEQLRNELVKRRLAHSPIDWPSTAR
jgi:hypothetical protein